MRIYRNVDSRENYLTWIFRFTVQYRNLGLVVDSNYKMYFQLATRPSFVKPEIWHGFQNTTCLYTAWYQRFLWRHYRVEMIWITLLIKPTSHFRYWSSNMTWNVHQCGHESESRLTLTRVISYTGTVQTVESLKLNCIEKDLKLGRQLTEIG